MHPRSTFVIGLVATVASCVANPSQTSTSQQLAEYGGDEDVEIVLPPPPPPPSDHKYPPPPPGHDPDGPYYPAPLYPCLSCHRPAGQPPLPAQCTRCHKITDPTDPHNGIYPPGQGPDFEPGGTPVPDFCLDCHRIKQMPMPVETWTVWTTL